LLRNDSEERSSHLHRGGSLKSRSVALTEEYNVMVDSEKLVGTTEYLTL